MESNYEELCRTVQGTDGKDEEGNSSKYLEEIEELKVPVSGGLSNEKSLIGGE